MDEYLRGWNSAIRNAVFTIENAPVFSMKNKFADSEILTTLSICREEVVKLLKETAVENKERGQ